MEGETGRLLLFLVPPSWEGRPSNSKSTRNKMSMREVLVRMVARSEAGPGRIGAVKRRPGRKDRPWGSCGDLRGVHVVPGTTKNHNHNYVDFSGGPLGEEPTDLDMNTLVVVVVDLAVLGRHIDHNQY